jgi:sugar O-acyltransferase (sialic acid O-acetyltransferase NeuD family)
LQNYIVVGTGGHGRTVLGYLTRMGILKNHIEFVDIFQKKNGMVSGCPIIGDLTNGYESKFNKAGMIVAYGGTAYSGNKEREIASKNVMESLEKGFDFIIVADPTAIISSDVEISKNVTIGIEAVLCPNSSIHEGSIINNKALIEHDVEIGAYSCISPGAIVLGGAKIGKRVFVGAGALIRDDITIGDDAVIAMGTVATEDITAGVLVVGNPARVIREL